MSFLLEIGFGILSGLLLGTFVGAILFGLRGQLVLSLVGAIAGSTVSKWLILRQQVKSSFWWLIVNIVGIPCSLTLSVITGSMANVVLRSLNSIFDLDLSSGLRFNLSAAIAVGVGITFYSIIAGIVLRWLSKRSVSKEIGNG